MCLACVRNVIDVACVWMENLLYELSVVGVFPLAQDEGCVSACVCVYVSRLCACLCRRACICLSVCPLIGRGLFWEMVVNPPFPRACMSMAF